MREALGSILSVSTFHRRPPIRKLAGSPRWASPDLRPVWPEVPRASRPGKSQAGHPPVHHVDPCDWGMVPPWCHQVFTRVAPVNGEGPRATSRRAIVRTHLVSEPLTGRCWNQCGSDIWRSRSSTAIRQSARDDAIFDGHPEVSLGRRDLRPPGVNSFRFVNGSMIEFIYQKVNRRSWTTVPDRGHVEPSPFWFH